MELEISMKTTFEKVRKFIYRNAKPLDLARWRYHFEDGSKEAVLSALSTYQNKDGGFGYALEADSFNPNSSPIQTWVATEILREIDFTDKEHPVIKGILNYLSCGSDFDTERRQWLNTVPSNNDYPCATWWKDKEDEREFKYNPTACLVGFVLKYGDRNSDFYQLSCEIAKDAYNYFMEQIPYHEEHVTLCFVRFYQYCKGADLHLIDMNEFREKLIEQVNSEICRDVERWNTEYVMKPSFYIDSKESIFYPYNQEIVNRECDYLINCQCEDGSYPITWQWWTDYKEFEVAKNWWKADFCIKNMIFLREFWREESEK